MNKLSSRVLLLSVRVKGSWMDCWDEEMSSVLWDATVGPESPGCRVGESQELTSIRVITLYPCLNPHAKEAIHKTKIFRIFTNQQLHIFWLWVVIKKNTKRKETKSLMTKAASTISNSLQLTKFGLTINLSKQIAGKFFIVI